ncbi:MAG TPA: hypothetical protein VMF65_18410 [Acidimicrobiales bacterium]|nr:hypothetical protein [Acidimicrobiales bacterium]
MTARAMEFSADEIAELVAVASQPGYRRWMKMARPTGGCADPPPPGEAICARTIAHDLAKNRSICRYFREEAA